MESGEIDLNEILHDIQVIEKDPVFCIEKNFNLRVKAIDDLEHIVDRINGSGSKGTAAIISLKQHAGKVRSDLEAVDITMFNKLREKISVVERKGDVLLELIEEYVGLVEIDGQGVGYGNLDIFLNGLLTSQSFPVETKILAPEMVYFQKTPARTVFEILRKCHLSSEDVFFDLGSGIGQVVILVHLLSGVKAKGVEFDPAFSGYASGCAAELNLSDVTFVEGDARVADYSDGTVFFMFTPFQGEMLQKILVMLKKESLVRKIRIVTLGPCTAEVALQPWLNWIIPEHDNIYKPGFFSSF